MIRKIVTFTLMAGIMMASCVGKGNKKDNQDGNPDRFSSSGISGGGDFYLLVGTYTSEKGSRGIYLYRFDGKSGKADSVGMAEVENASYLTLSPDERFIYAVSENDSAHSAVHAFAFDKSGGKIERLNSVPVYSASPCYITIDRKGRNLHTANYGGGTIASLQVGSDGALLPSVTMMHFEGSGPDTLRQEHAHLHSVGYSPDGKFLFATDLGSDKIYRVDVNDTPFEGQPGLLENSLKEFDTPPGTGPRHFAFYPAGGEFFYLIGELSGEVIVYDYASGELTQKQVVAADTVGARGSADIHLTPDGRFLYASNRLRADGIAIFSVNPEDGTLTKTGYQLTGKHPRNFVISPDGKFLVVACRDDNCVQVFRVDSENGKLMETGSVIHLDKPVCLKFAEITGQGG